MKPINFHSHLSECATLNSPQSQQNNQPSTTQIDRMKNSVIIPQTPTCPAIHLPLAGRLSRFLLALVLCLGSFAGIALRAQAQSPSDPTGPDSTLVEPKVWTENSDYAPGSTAAISGTAFQPGETVVLVVHHADGRPDTGADHQPWPVVADQAGSFQSQWHVCEDDCVGATLLITAVGQTSGFTAKYLFTDSTGSVVFSQFFQTGVTPTTQETAWNTFRAQLTAAHNYTKITILGTFDTTGVSTSDPVVVSQIAAALRTFGSVTWVSNGRTWNVNPNCVNSGSNVELTADGTSPDRS